MNDLALEEKQLSEAMIQQYGPIMDIVNLAEALHISRQGIYKQIDEGRFEIDHFKHGKKYLFSTQKVVKALLKSSSIRR